MRQLISQFPLEPDITALRPQVATNEVGQGGSENLSQPGQELAFGRAGKLWEMAMGFEKYVLNEVLRVQFSLQALSQLHSGQNAQVTPVAFQQLAQTTGIACSGL